MPKLEISEDKESFSYGTAKAILLRKKPSPGWSAKKLSEKYQVYKDNAISAAAWTRPLIFHCGGYFHIKLSVFASQCGAVILSGLGGLSTDDEWAMMEEICRDLGYSVVLASDNNPPHKHLTTANGWMKMSKSIKNKRMGTQIKFFLKVL